MPKDKARDEWIRTLDQIVALKPALAGHEGPGARHDLVINGSPSAIEFMKKYIADWDANVASSNSAAEMREKVLRQYPGLGTEYTLNDRIAAFFPGK